MLIAYLLLLNDRDRQEWPFANSPIITTLQRLGVGEADLTP